LSVVGPKKDEKEFFLRHHTASPGRYEHYNGIRIPEMGWFIKIAF